MVLVKNEEYWLPYVLKQCEGHFDSFVIYDVGSTDNTGNIIDWFYERNKRRCHLIVRRLPHVGPDVQGTFRNSMIPEGNRDVYFILDGDELYTEKDIANIPLCAEYLARKYRNNNRNKFGVVKRVEINEDLNKQYLRRRSHHRLYTDDAFWIGTHPGERPFFNQCSKSEIYFDHITCWHMHNTLRSPKEQEALSRLSRKAQRTYHPGDTMGDLDIIKELPILATPIENFKVTPKLEALQRKLKC
jgi:glycosyltransferase involved in cell wall biosynthesis